MVESKEIEPKENLLKQIPFSKNSRFLKNKVIKDAVIVLGVFAGLLFLYSLFNWTMSAIVHSRKEVMVPDVQGKSISDALSLASQMNLGLKKEGEELNNAVPGGTIVRQNPLPGMMVREGKIIRIILSQGGEVIFVPSLVGQPVRSAEIAIRSSALNLGEELTRYSMVVEKGKIVEQDPKAGTIAEKDSFVNMVVSAGPPPDGTILVPDFTGKDINVVKEWAKTNRVELDIVKVINTQSEANSVLLHKPPADSDITGSRSLQLNIASSSGDTKSSRKFYYEIPQGGEDRVITIVMIDDGGEHMVFKGIKTPGTKLEVPIEPRGSAKIRVFINGILVEERVQ